MKSILSMHLCWFLILKKKQKSLIWYHTIPEEECYETLRYQRRLLWYRTIPEEVDMKPYDTRSRLLRYHTIPEEMDMLSYDTKRDWQNTIPDEIVMTPYETTKRTDFYTYATRRDCYDTIRYIDTRRLLPYYTIQEGNCYGTMRYRRDCYGTIRKSHIWCNFFKIAKLLHTKRDNQVA